MFPKDQRLQLRKKREFFSRARTATSAHFVMFYIPTQEEKSMYAVIVPAARIQLATERNLLKRRMRVAIKEFDEILQKKDKSMEVVLLYKGRSCVSYESIKKEVSQLFSRL